MCAASPLAAVALPSPALAQESPPPPVWTDAEVRAAARRASPAVRRARAALEIARASRVFGRRPPVGNPTVGVIALPGWPDYGALTYGATLGLPIDVGGSRSAYGREAEAEVRVAEDRLYAAIHEAEQQARGARVDLALARALVTVQRERLDAASAAERGVVARVNAGASTAVDAALARRERAEAEADLASALRRETEALGAFRGALDLPPSEPVAVEPAERPEPVAREETPRAQAEAARRRRDLSALDRSAERWELTAQRHRASAVAPLTVSLEAQQVAVGPQEVANSIGASVRWELPFVQRAQGDQAVSRAEASGQRVAGVLLRRQIDREVFDAVSRLEHALAELDVLEREAVPAAERLVEATEASWAAGALDFFRVLVARRDLLAMRARVLEARRTAWQARIEFDRAMGGDATARPARGR
ncbi:MAG: TolC family protein [Polyangiales bacterium]